MPATEELEAGFYDFKVLDFLRVRPKVFLPPFGEHRDREHPATKERQDGGITGDLPKDAV